MKSYQDFEKYYLSIKNASTILEVLGWDQEVMMPENSANQRASQLSYMSAHLHQLKTNKQYLDGLAELLESKKLTPNQTAVCTRHYKDALKAAKVPESLVREISSATVLGQQAWKNAKDKSKVSLFKDDLKKIIDFQKLYAKCIQENGQSLYEALISEYEPEFPIEKIRNIFNVMKTSLVPLVADVIENQKSKNVNHASNQHQFKMNIEDQKKFNIKVLEKIGFDLSRGRLDTAAHPFCSGSADDVRLTTRFKEEDWTNSLYSVLHEAGHGMYEQGLGQNLGFTAASSVPSLGLHESQSRFWENCIGRSHAFSDFMSQYFSALNPKYDIKSSDYFQQVNSPEYSYIRVDSDELTYNLHILIRFEIEEALFNNLISVEECPAFWDSKVKEYLKLPYKSDAHGMLQDVHWSCGSFGYFPTYTIGNIIAAELDFSIRKKYDLDLMIREGRFVEIKKWLNENIHSVGLNKNTLSTIQSITGHELNPEVFIKYLKNKFL